MPVGRVKERSPLGHSGQRRLHEVVGSIDTAEGNANQSGLPFFRERWYEIIKRNAFQLRDQVSLDSKRNAGRLSKYFNNKGSLSRLMKTKSHKSTICLNINCLTNTGLA